MTIGGTVTNESARTGKLSGMKRGIATLSACAALFSGVIIGTPVLGASTAYAEPTTVAEAQAELDKIKAEQSQIEEDHAVSIVKLEEAEKAKAEATADLAEQTAKVEATRSTLGQVVQTTQQNNVINMTLRVLASESDEDFLGQMATMQSVTALTAERMARFSSEKARLAELEVTLATAVDTIAAEVEKQKALIDEYEAKEVAAQRVLDRLTAEERARLEAARRVREAAAAAAAARTASTSRAAAPAAAAPIAAAPAPSGRAGAAVSFAMAQIGKAYVWGGTGPYGYDCSGLMMAAYRAAGMSIPRTAGAQMGAGIPVASSDLQPGDLVFYYAGISHVAMYIGGGMVVQASTPATGINTTGVFTMPYMGARRYA